MPRSYLGVDHSAGGQRQRRAPVAEGGPDEHQITAHHTGRRSANRCRTQNNGSDGPCLP